MKLFGRVRLFATPWTVACQVPPSMGFSRKEYWSGLPMPSSRGSSQPRDLTRMSRNAGRFLTVWATWAISNECKSFWNAYSCIYLCDNSLHTWNASYVLLMDIVLFDAHQEPGWWSFLTPHFTGKSAIPSPHLHHHQPYWFYPQDTAQTVHLTPHPGSTC